MVVGKKKTGIQKKASCILVLKRRRPKVEMKTMYPDGIYNIYFTYLQRGVFFSRFREVGSFTIIYKKTG
jgi:hypothetical protein